MLISTLLTNLINRWNEWTDKRILIGENLFIELDKVTEKKVRKN
jgi:hypothetical protein